MSYCTLCHSGWVGTLSSTWVKCPHCPQILEAILSIFSANGDVKLDIPQADMPEVPDIPR